MFISDKAPQNNIKVSIIVPVYNVAGYLDKCLESIVEQTYTNIELILVDDGSTDDSGALCDRWIEKDSRIKVIHKENGGASSARNAGVKLANGDYLAFIDADDYWDSLDFLENAIVELNKRQVDLLIYGMKKVDEQGKISPDTMSSTSSIVEALRYGYLRPTPCNLLIRNHLISDNNITFREGVINEDMEWVALLYVSAATAQVITLTPYCYRQRSSSVTHNITAKQVHDVLNNYKRCHDLLGNMAAEKKDAYYYFLARAFSILLINVAELENKDRKEYFPFLRENAWILDYNIRHRERIIRLSVKLLGIKNTCKLLHLACRLR